MPNTFQKLFSIDANTSDKKRKKNADDLRFEFEDGTL
jgi:hypothetical protein